MSQYYGVVGKRDYIILNGQRIPYWEFLDELPSGWLSSLAYQLEVLPNELIIWDCGAWSYRTEEAPVLFGKPLTSQIALELYLQKARHGDILIAPDHMLIESLGELSPRRKFNRISAQEFISICPDKFHPMAVVHGVSLDEKLSYAEWVYDLGYKYISLGGLAGRATVKRENIEFVCEVREQFPDVWLHVLGLSSPDYAYHWQRIGIDSFDGSSHFKKAFTAGIFFTEDKGQLIKHQASRPGEEIICPLCDCRACSVLREHEIDTRTYGISANNMGRAAHNQNMLMRAHKWVMSPIIVLVSCVGEKASIPMPAKDLYRSTWFRKARRYAESIGDDWFILSAKHGLLDKDKIIEPYNQTMNDKCKNERMAWGNLVSLQLRDAAPHNARIVVLAGKHYRGFLDFQYEAPLRGLGIGQQLQWFDEQAEYKQLRFAI